MKARFKNKSTIQYILVSDLHSFNLPFLAPEEFNNNTIEFIKQCPVDLLQLIDPISFFEIYSKKLWFYGTDFKFFYTHSIENIIEHSLNAVQLTLIFLDSKSKIHEEIYQKLVGKNKLIFFYFRNLENVNNLKDKVVLSPFSFLNEIFCNQREILDLMNF